ncbi:Crp/Fnr family transcriptional regulator [Echinicola jeungdonensis]|uniref:Crp/Fnr family transcriptional regulator n=1 Tax=Echinicola jeungdonensis TaxID=709343 RepID=A0ABV5J3M3_9BACT|nr:Crp/Fnr family transcriptional regulator [Echinicola jeungdonensis]MDN3668226.1 Crp/Fnr family transcriptional regulator [Echinicola jeungdonensis]
MNQELILQNIAKHISLNPSEEEVFLSLLEPKTFKRKSIVLKEGEVARYTYFVVKGCLRTYKIDLDGSLRISHFAIEEYWVSDLNSFLTQTPAVEWVDALEETEVLQLSATNLERLYKEVPKFERFFRILHQNAYGALHRRLMKNISGTAEDRYMQFCKRYPGLENRISQKQVAAYLGITPEFLSKMKRKLQYC